MTGWEDRLANDLAELEPRFVDLRRLGDGAEGGAWAATDRNTRRKVVLKHVRPAGIPVLRRAARVLQRAASPHLPAVLEVLTANDGGAWLCTSWVDGEPVPRGPAEVGVALGEALGVAHALAAIHAAGTHHGDVSPGNVLITGTRGVVLVDLAQIGGHGSGTPGFLAPEVLGGGGGAAADRFSLGALLCFRLFGTVLWRHPAELVGVRTVHDVRRRLEQIAAGHPQVSSGVLRLLERLLHPDPDRRVESTEIIVDRLSGLVAAARVGSDFVPRPTFWIPTRWPYRGRPLGDVVARLVDRSGDRPRLVAIAGPEGSGRGRVVEEIVLELQTDSVGRDGTSARLVEPEGLGGAQHWLEAWIGEVPRRDEVLGVVSSPTWPSGLARLSAVDGQAAALRAAVRIASATLVMPVSTALGEALRGDATGSILVVDIEPWNASTVRQVVGEVLEDGDTDDWCDGLRAATGAWPGRVVRALRGAAAEALTRPDFEVLSRLAAQDVDDGLSREAALEIMHRRWGVPQTADGDDRHPFGWSVVAARAVLGDDLSVLAREVLDDTRARGEMPRIELAIDADDGSAVERVLTDTSCIDDPRVRATVADWLFHGRGGAVTDGVRKVVARALLRAGEASQALALLELPPVAAASRIERARALQRLARPQEALALLRDLDDVDAESLDMATGLRWRAWVDLGRAGDVLEDAERRATELTSRRGAGSATALLWAGYAALTSGDHDQAIAWLERARSCCPAQAPEIDARIVQLLGNVAHARGDLVEAHRCYAEAERAFERAGERGALAALRASLANVCVATWDLAEGIDHARRALRDFLARGDIERLPETVSALAQLLCRSGDVDEAAAWLEHVREVLAEQPAGWAAARLMRVEAEVRLARGEIDRAASELKEAAHRLYHCGALREAVDASLRTATVHRNRGATEAADELVRTARLWATDLDDWSVQQALVLAELRAAVDHDDAAARERTLRRLADFPQSEELCRRGHIDLAWSCDRVVLPLVCAVLPTGHPVREAVARRMLSTLELVMNKSKSLDRAAVRSALLTDGGDPGPIRELIEELATARDAGAVPAGASHRDRGTEAARLERLLRMYRRLAREDRLEPLLEQVVDAMMELTDAERGVVVVRPLGGGESLEVSRELAGGTDSIKFSRSIIARVMESGEPVLSLDAAEDDRFDQSRSISHLNLRSVLAVPLVFRGEVLGAAYVDHRLRRGNFDEIDLAYMEEFSELAALAVAHARALAAILAQAGALERQRAELAVLLDERDREVAGLREEVRSAQPDRPVHRGMIGETTTMHRVFRLIDRLAESDVPVVIRGESGTGKELVARAIHDGGRRSRGPFVAENCGAIPETLLEGVLFGHAKGAFTGAQQARAGLFEAAHGGTIFLDEVSEMSPGMQTKLLRVLQEGEVRRVGENVPRKVDVRVIAASNRDLEKLVEAGEFRKDLYYRINVVKLELPALRERSEDLPGLVRHFLAKHAGEKRLVVTAAAMRILSGYDWPGNVRELENEVQRWVALAEDKVTPEDLSAAVRGRVDAGFDPDDLSLRPRIDRLERELIERAIERTGGNQTRAAELLGLSRFGLQKKLKRLEEGP